MPLRMLRTFAFTATTGIAAFAFTVNGWVSPVYAIGGDSPSPPVSTTPAGTSLPVTTTAGAGSQADLQIRAQELAGEIEANGRTLDELDAAYNAAQIRLRSLDSQQAALRTGMVATAALASQAEKALKEQALLAYMTGGAPIISYVPDKPGQDPSLTLSYAEIISGSEKRAASNYRTDVNALRQQSAALTSTQHDATLTLASIQADQSSAEKTMAEQQVALNQVKGQMAVLVSQVEAAQQQAAARAVQSRLDRGMATQPAAQTLGQTSSAGAPGSVAPTVQGNAGSPPVASRGSTVDVGTAQPPPPVPAPTSTSATPQPPPATIRPTPATPASTADPAPVTTAPIAISPTANPPVGTGSGPTARSLPPQAPGAGAAIAYARAQIGKPYQWAAAGPDSFDCSGLVMMAWQQSGVDFPHLAQDQYDMTTAEPLSDALPGDLVFFGTPDNVYHVGIYVGNGEMIDAPDTGQNVRVESIYWGSLLGAGRVHS